ncbi:DELLA protein GAI [Heracleum sosnowskyi]|uniref:DELLA protein GAI n=1 Tax=Heracleum sosnowskyi TaxID=360622 RepID=A0AAD8JGA9_9APIA|nr:DELLA protein GAI [Heracleum sosnowskyi]
MAPGFYLQSKFCDNDEKNRHARFLDHKLSGTKRYSTPYRFNFEESFSDCLIPFLDETQSSKKLKETPCTDEFVSSEESFYSSSTSGFYSGSNSGSTESLNSVSKPHFRDHIWAYTQRYLAAETMEEAAAALIGGDEDEVKEEGSADGMRLVQLLIACAEAVACRDKLHASTLLSELRSNALVFGTSFQRVASCFVQGLSDRLALVQPLGTVGVVIPHLKTMAISSEKEEALSLVYNICPHIQFGHFVANSMILEAFEGESSVHVVDLGMSLGLRHGHQWRSLMNSLANRAGKPRRLHITGVGNCAEHLQEIGDDLEQYAFSLGLNFEFSVVECNLENLQPRAFKLIEGEVLVINSILHLHCVVKESRGALNAVLQKLHQLSPKYLILVEQDSSHNGPFFLGRFMEALHYYSAIFDSLDTMLPRYDTRRAKIEQFYFAEEIKNIVSCEGPARVERHERADQWRRRMSRAGFQSAPIKKITQTKQWLEKMKISEGYTTVEEKGCLILGWKSKPIIAASCWKCSSV